MKLIVGLGNPGRKYQRTRHNIGYLVLAELANRHASGNPRGRFDGEAVEAQVQAEKVLLLSPTTYMNKSGSSVQPARDFYKLENADILVICDDFNLPLGRLRFRPSGSAGGQKGLADIIRRLGGDDVPRLRVGIGPPPDGWDVADYVLSKFTAEEQSEIDDAVSRAANGAADWAGHDMAYCMNRYNAAASDNEST